MNSRSKVSVIILTYNEAENIVRSIQNTISWAHQVIVLDSYSEDNTVEIANSLGAKVVQRKFDNYSAQRNYAIQKIQIETEWILFLDADEYLSEDLKKEINSELEQRVDEINAQIKAVKVLLFDAKVQCKSNEISQETFDHVQKETDEMLQYMKYEKDEILYLNQGILNLKLKNLTAAIQSFDNSIKINNSIFFSKNPKFLCFKIKFI